MNSAALFRVNSPAPPPIWKIHPKQQSLLLKLQSMYRYILHVDTLQVLEIWPMNEAKNKYYTPADMGGDEMCGYSCGFCNSLESAAYLWLYCRDKTIQFVMHFDIALYSSILFILWLHFRCAQSTPDDSSSKSIAIRIYVWVVNVTWRVRRIDYIHYTDSVAWNKSDDQQKKKKTVCFVITFDT